ncbi:MAG: aminotransferase class I/II-fold pyridoxal phosphate-dependent enzyme [Anaerolineae bacterium]|nr:MAG: aminotransferase class I/II-fold pyridoxal phosphate-dependent enzyme [Anaerolineae bacterium]
MQPADRVSASKPYFFAQLGKRINQLKANGVDVIRLDMGSPDLPPADFIIDAMANEIRKPDVHGYTLGGGVQKFRQAVTNFYSRRFGVELDPMTEVIDLIGSKEGLFIISQVLVNRGDVALVPDPGYGVYAAGAEVAGADVVAMPLLAENEFLPDLGAIPTDAARRAKVMFLNYPNNPTGATANLAFFEKVVAFAKEYDILVAHDAPYADVAFDAYRAPSILQIAGAKDVAVEFNSFSKIYNMAGWRLGMALGNRDVLGYIENYKSLQDSAMFGPIMTAGVAALQGDQEWIEERNQVYQERRDIALSGLRAAGFEVATPKAALYLWIRLPEGEDSTDFCARLLDETGVSLTPGVVFGKHGEGYMRLSLVTATERITEGVNRICDWMKTGKS